MYTQDKIAVVYTARTARHLLRNGYQMIDMAPNRKFPTETVYYFKNEDNIFNAIKEVAHKEPNNTL